MKPTIQAVPKTEPTLILSVNMETETIHMEVLNADSAARLSLLNLALDYAKDRLIFAGTNGGTPAA